MDALARTLLEKLLAAGNKSEAGIRRRPPALTATQLTPYRELRSLQHKTACEVTLFEARAADAIEIVKDRTNPEDGFIERVNLRDVRALARFLGEIPYADRLAEATRRLAELEAAYPVLADVTHKWSQMGRVRGLGPDNVQDWIDAAQVIAFASARAAMESISLPIREASARLFRDSKRVERLVGPVDVLLSGSVESPARPAPDVWQEIGLFRVDQPVLLAGRVEIERERVTALLDAPYGGFPASAIRRVTSALELVMTIENLTTFHSEAKRRCEEPILLIYTAGMPSPTWRAMYARVLREFPATVPIFHWGDIDEGGFRIAATLAQDALAVGHAIQPWAMHPHDVPEDLRTRATPRTLSRIQHFAKAAGWPELGDAVVEAGFTVEQEGLA